MIWLSNVILVILIKLWLLRSWNCQNRESQRACYCKVTMWFRSLIYHGIFDVVCSNFIVLVVIPSTARSREGFGRAHRQSVEQEQRLAPGGGGPWQLVGGAKYCSCSWITVFHTELGRDCVHQRYYFHSCSLGWGKRSIQFLHWSWKVLRGGVWYWFRQLFSPAWWTWGRQFRYEWVQSSQKFSILIA